MTEIPPSETAPVQDETPTPSATPPKKPARKRCWPLKKIGVIAACVLAGLVVLLGVALVGARHYVATDGGRERVSGLVQNLKLSRFGRLHVYGLKGDVLKDFSVDRITVTDSEGVWLDARNLRMKWSYTALLGRRLHAQNIQADVIQVIRRPVLEEAKDEPPGGPMPISIRIDKFATKLDLMEGFSKEYGRWSLAGDASVPLS